jgi:hypothetical protein
MDDEFLAGLLYEEESATLDFKKEQYRFVNATKEDKSELLKEPLKNPLKSIQIQD